MANVLFKQGLQDALNAIKTNKTAVEGTFYLTTDTYRLYIGRITDTTTQSSTACDVVPVNEGVSFVASVASLPGTSSANAGEFYYAAEENILCVYNGAKWVQINPNTDTKVDGLDLAVTTSDGVATIKTTVKYTTPEGVTGGGSQSDSFTIQGAGGAKVTSSGKAVTITGEQYDLNSTFGTNSATVNLTSTSGEDDSSITIKGGSNVTVENDNGAISIKATSNQVTGVSVTSGNGSIASPSTNGFNVKVTDQIGTQTGSVDPVIAVGTDSTLSDNQVHFVNGTATLPVYSKSDIDTLLQGLNAMTLKGELTSSPSTLTNIESGDTYIVTQGFTFLNDGVSTKVSVGDLLIATGTETDGVITSDLKWVVVASGDDSQITYTGAAVTNGLKINNSLGTTVGQITVSGGNKINITDSGSGTTSALTVNHDTVTTTTATGTAAAQSVNTAYTLSAITDIEQDDYGHITKITTTPYSLKDTNSTLSGTAVQIATTNTNDDYTATITNSVKSLDSNGSALSNVSGAYDVKSSSLQISSTAATINSVSGSATTKATMTIDMVWGSF